MGTDDPGLGAAVQEPRCKNCAVTRTGQYCWNCGQRARSRVITLWELSRDLIGDVFELDSRLWRSLLPLLFRPGQLTEDYLEGRRVRYVPPFRMYLVLGIVFFLLANLGGVRNGLAGSASRRVS